MIQPATREAHRKVSAGNTALVIEDDTHVARVLLRLLSGLGFEAYEAGTAAAADAFLEEFEASLILLDLRLPQRSGDDWLISFRKRDTDTPVMVISGVNDPMRKAAVLRDGADVYVTKPFEIVELEAQIGALLRRPRCLAERAICDGLAYLNPTRCELRVGGVKRQLTQREFGILWFLSLHEGRWVAAATLSAAVLGDETHSNVESTRVHVFNMRQKLGHLADIFAIESRRQLGYRMIRPVS